MRYKDIANELIKKLSLTPIQSYESVSQNGRYLVFEGVEAVNVSRNRLKFSILVAANSLNADKNNALDECEDIIDEIFKMGAVKKQMWFGGVKAGFVNQSLYIYAISLNINISRV